MHWTEAASCTRWAPEGPTDVFWAHGPCQALGWGWGTGGERGIFGAWTAPRASAVEVRFWNMSALSPFPIPSFWSVLVVGSYLGHCRQGVATCTPVRNLESAWSLVTFQQPRVESWEQGPGSGLKERLAVPGQHLLPRVAMSPWVTT